MKPEAVVTLALFAATHALAADQSAIDKMCESMSNAAGTIMKARQVGVPMSKLMETISSGDKNEYVKANMREIVITAYESPRFSSPDYQQRAAEDFRDRWYLRCEKTTR